MYKVMKLYLKGPEIPVGTYDTMSLAKKIIQDELAKDINLRVTTTYRLYEGFDLIGEFDASELENSGLGKDSEESTSPGTGKNQTFNPTPFNMTPHLGPRTWIKDEPADDEEDKK